MKTLKSDEIYSCVESMVKEAERSVKISSAWLKGSIVDKLLSNLPDSVELEVILRASELQDLLITDDYVFRKIEEKGGQVFLSNRLHAKFILVDEKRAVVGSANFTGAGFSGYDSGNIEAAVYYDIDDDEEEVKELFSYFEQIKSDSAKFDENLLGFAINPVKSRSFEFILIEPDVKEQSYVEVKHGEGTILAKIVTIYSYDMGFFANPFSAGESPVFGSVDTFKTLFTGRKGKEWKKAAVWSYLNENSDRVKVAVAEVLGIIKNGKLETNMEPFDVGEPVYLASSDTLRNLVKRTFSGKSMTYPVKVGTFEDGEQEVFIDGKEVITKHMLILGTTGSGKSHFTKIFLSRFLKDYPVQTFIFDPHGEYYDELSDSISQEDIMHVVFEETLFPIHPDEVEWLVKEAGFSYLVSGNSGLARDNKAYLSSLKKPSLKRTVFKDENLLDILSKVKDEVEEEIETPNGKSKKVKKRVSAGVEKEAAEIFGEKILTTQVETYNQLISAVESSEKVVIFNFSRITDPVTRVNIAGLAMQELFNQNKEHKKERLIVLEEAHNFAPEGSYGDVSAGKDNLALTMARKIASEGRKFNLGLVVITQRPAQVSKYVLSQANTQAMFRTMNVSDLAAVETYVEFAGRDLIDLLPSLQTGMGILSGLGVPFPVVVEVDG
ncbi:helicase HerA domain-containing protein [Desulfurobacterium sp.]